MDNFAKEYLVEEVGQDPSVEWGQINHMSYVGVRVEITMAIENEVETIEYKWENGETQSVKTSLRGKDVNVGHSGCPRKLSAISNDKNDAAKDHHQSIGDEQHIDEQDRDLAVQKKKKKRKKRKRNRQAWRGAFQVR